MIAILSLLMVVTLFVTASRVATVALIGTGMASESACFQARSALMGVGFTTTEAEDVIEHPVRRKIILWLMTFGNAGIITGVVSLLLTFIDAETEQTLERAGVLVGGLILLLVLSASKRLERFLTRLTVLALSHWTHLDTRDYGALLRLAEDYSVIELRARDGDWLVGRPLEDLGLTEEGVVVLGVHRHHGDYLGVPIGSTVIEPDDVILAYGRLPILKDLDERHVGWAGDRAHREAVIEQQHIIEEVLGRDEAATDE